MMTALPPAARTYLDELRRLLAHAPDRELVLDGVERHIADALADGPVDDARVRAVLDELGDPAAIAAEAAPDSPARPPFLERRGGAVLTVLLLAVGGVVVPFVGWIVGLGLLWSSKGWSLADKLVGTLAPFLLAAAGAASAWALGTGAVHLGLLLGPVLYAILVFAHLLPRFRPAAD